MGKSKSLLKFYTPQIVFMWIAFLYPYNFQVAAALILGLINYSVFPVIKYAYRPRAPFIVLDDVNSIFIDKDLFNKFYPLINDLLTRMDNEICNAVFLISDSSCYEDFINIQGYSQRINLFHFDELKLKNFEEGICPEATFKFYQKKKNFEKFM